MFLQRVRRQVSHSFDGTSFPSKFQEAMLDSLPQSPNATQIVDFHDDLSRKKKANKLDERISENSWTENDFRESETSGKVSTSSSNRSTNSLARLLEQ